MKPSPNMFYQQSRHLLVSERSYSLVYFCPSCSNLTIENFRIIFQNAPQRSRSFSSSPHGSTFSSTSRCSPTSSARPHGCSSCCSNGSSASPAKHDEANGRDGWRRGCWFCCWSRGWQRHHWDDGRGWGQSAASTGSESTTASRLSPATSGISSTAVSSSAARTSR